MAIHDGSKILIKIEDSALVGLTSTGKSLTTDMIETTTKDSDGDKTYIPGERGCSISFEIKIDEDAAYGYSDLFAAWKAGTELAWVIGGTGAGDVTYSGDGYIESLDDTAPQNDVQTASGTIRVTGEVTEGVVGT